MNRAGLRRRAPGQPPIPVPPEGGTTAMSRSAARPARRLRATDAPSAATLSSPHRMPARAAAGATKWVYLFGEGDATMKALLGGKGAHLAEMTRLGLPGPPGLILSTDA